MYIKSIGRSHRGNQVATIFATNLMQKCCRLKAQKINQHGRMKKLVVANQLHHSRNNNNNNNNNRLKQMVTSCMDDKM